MSSIKTLAANSISYSTNVGRINFTHDDVVDRTVLPVHVPTIAGWSGPARVGSTALLFLLANHHQVDRIYFQPQKTLLRFGTPAFEIVDSANTICMKETYGQKYVEEYYDPVGLLIKAGVPAEKIRWVSILRDPFRTFASWKKLYPAVSPVAFVAAQKHTIQQYFDYKERGIKVIPFVYDQLKDDEVRVLGLILEHFGLASGMDLNFDRRKIESKMVPGQAADPAYYKENLKATRDKKKFVYSTNQHSLSPVLKNQIYRLCWDDYVDFLKIAQKELGAG